MTSEKPQDLRQLNRRLADLLEQIQQPAVLSSSSELGELLEAVIEAGECIKEPAQQVPESERSALVQQYRTLLESLRDVLPAFEMRLRMERARLETEHSQLVGASCWTEAAKVTLSRR
jgi:nitrogen-specific signal transduction histidine kinase